MGGTQRGVGGREVGVGRCHRGEWGWELGGVTEESGGVGRRVTEGSREGVSVGIAVCV